MTERQAAERENQARKEWVEKAEKLDRSILFWEIMDARGSSGIMHFYPGLHRVHWWNFLYPGKGRANK